MGHDVTARFDRPELTPLWRELRRRFEVGGGPVTRVRLGPLSPAQRSAVADLLGLRGLPEETPTVQVARLDAVLVAAAGLDARGVVAAITGPLGDRAAERRSRREARDALWAWLDGHPVVAAEPALLRWSAQVRSLGLVDGSVATTRSLLGDVIAVLAALPAAGCPLPALADRVCHDPHALDDGRRVPGYVLRALASRTGTPPPRDAEQRRALWERFGVSCDGLSATVLVAGLRPTGTEPLAITLRAWADCGQATALTPAQLGTCTSVPHAHHRVWVVENPSVLAQALARFGPACPPLVCTSGWPNGAVTTLLRRLAEAGASLAHHGDLDGEGVRITDYLMARTGARPWRMAAADYLAAVKGTGPPVGRVSEAPWDERLAPAMLDRAVAVPEEAVTDLLLDELAEGYSLHG